MGILKAFSYGAGAAISLAVTAVIVAALSHTGDWILAHLPTVIIK